MNKKSTFKKTLATLIFTLSALPVLAGEPLITEPAPVPESIVTEQNTGKSIEPGIQPLDDREYKEQKGN